MKAIIIAILAASLSGCVSVEHTSYKDGKVDTMTKYSSPAFGSKGIVEADFQRGIVKGVRSEQSSMAEMAAALYQAGLSAAGRGTP